jgi:hypothetical protein
VTIRMGPRVVGLMLLVPVTSCGVVLSLVRPYPRACNLLRRLAFPWWGRFESSGLCVVYAYERGENLSPIRERCWNPEIRILLFAGHVTYRHALTSGALLGVASRKPGVLVCCPTPGRFLSDR